MSAYPELIAACEAVYLNTGAAGPLPRSAHEVILRETHLELIRGRVQQSGKHKFLASLERLRGLAAAVIGSQTSSVAVTGSTSEGVNIALWGLPLGAGDHVLTTTFEHLGGLAGLSTLCRAKQLTASFYAPHNDCF